MISSVCRCDPNNGQHGDACPIIRELRRPAADKLADYREEIRKRQAELEQEDAVDVPYRLQTLGVPVDAILAVRRPRETRASDSVARFRASPRDLIRTLLLMGPRGVGKTVAAALVLADFVKRHDWNSAPSGGRAWRPFFWVHAAEVTSQVDFGRVDPEWLEGLKRCRLLVLDDLGKEATAPGLVALRDVLTERHEKHRPTVITTNLDREEMESRYGPSWYERLKVAALAPDLKAEKSLRGKPKS